MNSDRVRLTSFYIRYCPENVPKVDSILEKYAGKEDAMFKALEKKYGPEPDDNGGFRSRLVAFYLAYSTDNLCEVDRILEKYAGREDAMFKALVSKYGPEPADENEKPFTTSGSDYRRRLKVFYEKYCPEKVPNVDATLEKYAGKEDAMFKALVSKYGPEPADENEKYGPKPDEVKGIILTTSSCNQPSGPEPVKGGPEPPKGVTWVKSEDETTGHNEINVDKNENVCAVNGTKNAVSYLPMKLNDYSSKLVKFGISEERLRTLSEVYGHPGVSMQYVAMMTILLRLIPVQQLFQESITCISGEEEITMGCDVKKDESITRRPFEPLEVPMNSIIEMFGKENLKIEKKKKIVRVINTKEKAPNEEETKISKGCSCDDEEKTEIIEYDEAILYAETVSVKDVIEPVARLYAETVYTIKKEVIEPQQASMIYMMKMHQTQVEQWRYKAYIVNQAIKCIGALESERRETIKHNEMLRWEGTGLWFRNRKTQIMRDCEIAEDVYLESQMMIKKAKFKQMLNESHEAILRAKRENNVGKWTCASPHCEEEDDLRKTTPRTIFSSQKINELNDGTYFGSSLLNKHDNQGRQSLSPIRMESLSPINTSLYAEASCDALPPTSREHQKRLFLYKSHNVMEDQQRSEPLTHRHRDPMIPIVTPVCAASSYTSTPRSSNLTIKSGNGLSTNRDPLGCLKVSNANSVVKKTSNIVSRIKNKPKTDTQLSGFAAKLLVERRQKQQDPRQVFMESARRVIRKGEFSGMM